MDSVWAGLVGAVVLSVSGAARAEVPAAQLQDGPVETPSTGNPAAPVPTAATPPAPAPATPPAAPPAVAAPDTGNAPVGGAPSPTAPTAPAAPPAQQAPAPPAWSPPPAFVAPIAPLAGPPPPDPSIHRHDGFYFRFGTGLGGFVDTMSSRRFQSATYSGAALSGELLVGGTVAPGLVIGGGTHGGSVLSPALTIDGKSTAGPNTLALSVLGIFADYYFDPTRGLHAQLLLGYGILQADASLLREDPDGFGGAVGIGNEWWVSEQWSLGVMARLLYASLGYDSTGLAEHHSIVLPAVLATVTYH